MAQNDLTPWRNFSTSPFNMLRDFEEEMDQVFQDFFPERRRGQSRRMRNESYFIPACDIEEREDHFLISADLPGMKKDDVRIEVQGDQLTISGERKDESMREDKSGKYMERTYGSFRRSFSISKNLDLDKIEASFENGVLSISVPKMELTQTKQIPVKEKKEGFIDKILGKKKETSMEEGKSESGKQSLSGDLDQSGRTSGQEVQH